jgi:hypothetical protein
MTGQVKLELPCEFNSTKNLDLTTLYIWVGIKYA